MDIGGTLMGIGVLMWLWGGIKREELSSLGVKIIVFGGGALLLLGSFI